MESNYEYYADLARAYERNAQVFLPGTAGRILNLNEAIKYHELARAASERELRLDDMRH